MNTAANTFNNGLLKEYVEGLANKYDWGIHSLYRETNSKIGWEIEISVCKDKGVPVGDIVEEKQFYYDSEEEMEEDYEKLDELASFD